MPPEDRAIDGVAAADEGWPLYQRFQEKMAALPAPQPI